MNEPTIEMPAYGKIEVKMRSDLKLIADALREKNYDPVRQIVGYILTEDPTYITTHNDARKIARRIDRDELLLALVRSYLED